MSRVIKFRGYDQENKCWRHGHYYEGVMTDAPLCLNDCRISRVIIIDGTFYHVAPESVGQFTGLTDSNGVEIYEGDVCCIAEDRRFVSKVCFHKGGFTFADYMGGAVIAFATQNIEVIGNVYEHQHMLYRSSA